MLYCNECGKRISPEAYKYSREHFNRALCGQHQREARLGSKITPQARTIGEILKQKGHNVEYEKWDHYKHIDIAITKCKVNIEIDGPQHNLDPKQALADLKRTYYSFKKGFITLRIPNCLVQTAELMQETANFIDEFLQESKGQLEEENW